MDAFSRCVWVLATWLPSSIIGVVGYQIRNHPCCMDPTQNITLAMIIDAFEIYGHDPSDKLDNLWLYAYEMNKIKTAEDQYKINERIHIATDHLARFVNLHVKELKVLLITLDDVLDNMLSMFDTHNQIAAERQSSVTGGPVPTEFYMSQEYQCGKNVYIFVSEQYSDIYNMGKGYPPYCKYRSFIFMGFVHNLDEDKYYLLEDPSIAFPTDNYLQGLECHIGICIYRFPYKKMVQKERDIVTLPKAIVKCGLVMYKLPPLSATSCIISSGIFILDFNIQGVRYRHQDYLLSIPNGVKYYTKEDNTPLSCDHHVCEWNYTNTYGGPFVIPGDPTDKHETPVPFIDVTTPKPPEPEIHVPTVLKGCFYIYPPNYGSIAGKSYLDPIGLHDGRFTCSSGVNKGLYWYPQWMAALPPSSLPSGLPQSPNFKVDNEGFLPHQMPAMDGGR